MTKSIVFQNQTLLQKIYEKALDIFPRFSMTGPSLSTRASAHTPIHTPAWASSAGPVVAPCQPIHTQDPPPAVEPTAPTPQIPVNTRIADPVLVLYHPRAYATTADHDERMVNPDPSNPLVFSQGNYYLRARASEIQADNPEVRADNLKVQLDGLKAQADGLEVQLDGLKGLAGGLKVRADGLKGQADGLKDRVDDLKVQLDVQVDGPNIQLDGLEVQGDGLEAHNRTSDLPMDVPWVHCWKKAIIIGLI
ncbi:hypothetical protein FRC06_000733 [Ceratobasidium sp. 370]|nr:hypothetical protein FRC06_000733 [Ceratobasidium sp. 370]